MNSTKIILAMAILLLISVPTQGFSTTSLVGDACVTNSLADETQCTVTQYCDTTAQTCGACADDAICNDCKGSATACVACVDNTKWGSTCTTAVTGQIETVNIAGDALTCKNSKHTGILCATPCPAHVATCTFVTTVVTAVTCADGYYGLTETVPCSQTCTDTNAATCLDTGVSQTCKQGFAGDTCATACPGTNVESCDKGTPATINSCKPGYWAKVDATCATACAPVLTGNSARCDKTTGATVTECKAGFAQAGCTTACTGTNVANIETCSFDDESDILTCKAGFSGSECGTACVGVNVATCGMGNENWAVTCKDGAVLADGQCDTCASTHFQTAAASVCTKCDANCLTCGNDAAKTCQTCNPKFTLNSTTKVCKANTSTSTATSDAADAASSSITTVSVVLIISGLISLIV